MNTLKLGAIEEEATACRAAWAAMPNAKYGVHIHHAELAEEICDPIESRIKYILSHKTINEQALRLRLMRPITAAAWRAYNKAHAAARQVYDKAKAAAWGAYNKATIGSWEVYDKATTEALKAYNKARDKAHGLVCTTPDCPYKNGSIFNED